MCGTAEGLLLCMRSCYMSFRKEFFGNAVHTCRMICLLTLRILILDKGRLVHTYVYTDTCVYTQSENKACVAVG